MVSPTQLCWRYYSLPLSRQYDRTVKKMQDANFIMNSFVTSGEYFQSILERNYIMFNDVMWKFDCILATFSTTFVEQDMLWLGSTFEAVLFFPERISMHMLSSVMVRGWKTMLDKHALLIHGHWQSYVTHNHKFGLSVHPVLTHCLWDMWL